MIKTKDRVSIQKGNTPVKSIPDDYYPEQSGFWFEIGEGLDKGKKLFFRDSKHGTGPVKTTIVFVHGNPENSYIYRKIIRKIISTSDSAIRIIALDHIGFGLSDQASYEMTSMDHSENLFQLIEHLNLQDVTLVVHDWGGPIGIGAFSRAPERVRNLVFTNTTVFPMPDEGLTYKNFPIRVFAWSNSPLYVRTKDWGLWAAYAVQKGPANILKMVVDVLMYMIRSRRNPENLNEFERVLIEQFSTRANVKSSQRMVRQSAHWGKGNSYFEPNLKETRDTSEFYRSIQDNIKNNWAGENKIGVRGILGLWDPLAKKQILKQWLENLPQAKKNIRTFAKTGHFIEEAQPDAIARAILEVAGLR